MLKTYTIETLDQPRGTAGAAALIPELRAAIEAIDGQVLDTYVLGPRLFAHVRMDSKHYGTVAEWPQVYQIYLSARWNEV